MGNCQASYAGKFPMGLMVSRIVDRCHVGMSNREMIYYVISRLKHPSRQTYWAMPKEVRKLFLRTAVACHKSNQSLYKAVTSGRF